MKKNILVAGSSGFIGGHLVKFLKAQGHHVIGADIVPPMYGKPDEFVELDLRKESNVDYLFGFNYGKFDQVYNLACLMGGMGFIGDPKNDYDIMVGSTRIVANLLEMSRKFRVAKLFYSSSACVYNEDKQTETFASLKESDAYPAMPDLVYGWQKLFSEQMCQATRSRGVEVKIARFHNIFGPEGAYDGGKEKAPAALCRKVALAKDGDAIEVWGDGQQNRSFLYIYECLEGIHRLMKSDFPGPVNIGSDENVTINQLAKMIINISGKNLSIHNVPGPAGVRSRNSNNFLIKEALGWAPHYPLSHGLAKTYHWISEQLNAQQKEITHG